MRRREFLEVYKPKGAGEVKDHDPLFVKVYVDMLGDKRYFQKPNELTLYIALKSYGVVKDEMYPTVKDIAKKALISERKAQDILKVLEERGVIVTLPCFDMERNGIQINNIYHLAPYDGIGKRFRTEDLELYRTQKRLYLQMQSKEKELGQGGTRTNS